MISRYAAVLGFVLLFIGAFLLFNPMNKPGDWAPKNLTFNEYENWVEYKAEAGFLVKFPFEPQRATETMVDSQTREKRFYDMYLSETPVGKLFMVSIITFPEESHKFKDTGLMRRIVMEMVQRKEDNRLEKLEVSTMQGIPALDFIVKGERSTIEGTTFMDGKRLFLLVEVAQNDVGTKEFEYFRNSFRLGGK